MKKKIIYIDLDGVVADFDKAVSNLSSSEKSDYINNYQNITGIYAKLQPIPGSIVAIKKISKNYDTYILTAAPWHNPSAWSDKLIWVKKFIPQMKKRLIISHNKHLNKGDFLIDDNTYNGAANFQGKLIRYGSDEFKDWDIILKYLDC